MKKTLKGLVGGMVLVLSFFFFLFMLWVLAIAAYNGDPIGFLGLSAILMSVLFVIKTLLDS
jgi:hypothetical protein